MAKDNQGSEPSNLADHDQCDAANAVKVWGFKIISRFNKLSDTTKSTVVSHNMNILKDLPSEIKKSIIKKCIKNKSNDFVGLQYLKFYVPGQENHVAEKEPKRAIRKKRSSAESTDSGEEEENWTPPKKKREKEKAVQEEIKGKITEQQNPSREYFLENKVRVKHADSEKEEEEEEEKRTPAKKKKGKEKARENTVIPMPARELPEEIKGKIVKLNGTDIKWVITKRLFSSDVTKNLNRFSMPLNQIDIGFLTDEERERLDEGGGIEVGMVGHTGELSKLVLKRWKMDKPSGKVIITYNLITGWYKDIVEANGLEIGQLVHVWSFRVGKNLSFALVKVDE